MTKESWAMNVGWWVLIAFLLMPNVPAMAGTAQDAVEFDGPRISFRLTPDSFLALSYEKRADLLADLTGKIIRHAETYSHCTDLVDILSRLRTGDRPGEILVADRGDPELAVTLRHNVKFLSNLPRMERQESLLMDEIDRLKKFGYVIDAAGVLETLYGLTDTLLQLPGFTPQGRFHLMRAMIYHDIAKAAGAGPGRAASEKLEALMDWTFINVSWHFERDVSGAPGYYSINDIPLELMVRAMGDCDQNVWTLTTLAWHAGLEAHVVYLYKDRANPSFHTVAEIRTENGWKAVDSFNRKLYDRSVYELSKTEADFKNSCIYLNAVEVRAGLPQMWLAELICRNFIPDQRLFFDAGEAVRTFAGDLLGRRGTPARIREIGTKIFEKITAGIAADRFYIDEIGVGRWHYPFWLRGYYTQAVWPLMKLREYPFLYKLRPARMAQLLGRFDQAEESLRLIIPSANDSELFYEERDYLLVLNEYLGKNKGRMKMAAEDFMAAHPDSPRNKIIRWMLGH